MAEDFDRMRECLRILRDRYVRTLRERDSIERRIGELRGEILLREKELAKFVGILGEGALTGEEPDHECG